MSEQPGQQLQSVLVVDDDAAVAQVLVAILQQAGFAATALGSGAAALEELSRRPHDLVLSDVRMPGLDGLQLLAQIGVRHPEVPVILLTAHGTIPLAVQAMKAGAADFVLKPFDRQEILYAVRKALLLGKAVEARPNELRDPGGAALVGSSASLREAMALLDKAARGDATVLLRGESGTGKELFAQALHQRGPRAAGPFIEVHCAALPETLLESELFGYEKGAFTGATSRKPGRVELAEGGTLFLDEIGDISPAVQVKLLRLLQERAYERLGGAQTLRANVRFVAATHRDLEALTARGQFREDLFYRLSVVPIWLPPLRERQGDVARLAQRFVVELGREHGKNALLLEPEAQALLSAQPWPGNVRQLRNFIERLVVLGDGDVIGPSDVQRELSRNARPAAVPGSVPAAASGELEARRREAERAAISEALGKCQGNRTLAARLLGVSRRTLYNKLEELGLG